MTGAELIAAERERQVSEEGWTAEHDAQHGGFELSAAAATYALDVGIRSAYWNRDALRHMASTDRVLGHPSHWPWSPSWWKPTPGNPVRQLVKAGALIAAEIDRLQAISP